MINCFLKNLLITGIGVNCIEQGKTRRKLLSSTGNFYLVIFFKMLEFKGSGKQDNNVSRPKQKKHWSNFFSLL